eukprot:2198834-Prymnesium_polylepis.1
MQLSEESEKHLRTQRLKREADWQAARWWRNFYGEREAARAASEHASELKRQLTAAGRENRRVCFQTLSLQRQ